MYEALFQPICIGRLLIKNRIEAAPSLPLLASEDGSVTLGILEYYHLKAAGGAGIVTVAESAIDSDRAPSHPGQLRVDDDGKIAGLAALAEVIKSNGARASIELNHAGRQTTPQLLNGRPPISPSPIPSAVSLARAGRSFEVQEMTLDQIEAAVEAFAAAARRVQRAGFDMVLLHGGHGWLLSQFVSPLVNRRTDAYGGSLENRARFPLEVLARIRSRCGPDLPIEYRFSADELVPGGLGPEEAVRFAQLIADHVDCLHVSCGMIAHAQTSPFIHAANYLPRGRNVYLAELVKQAVDKPVTAVGGIVDAEMANQVVAQGKADVVAMCRALIADPELPVKAETAASQAAKPSLRARPGEAQSHGSPSGLPRVRAVRPCVRCNDCLARVASWRPMRCAVNPLSGRELDAASVQPAATPTKVIVVGGGPAGMQAALVAADRGHEVVLLESQRSLGGDLFAASRPWFKDDMRRFLDYMVTSIHDSPVQLCLGATVTADTIRAEGPCSVVIAVGAEPHFPTALAAARPAVLWAGDVEAGLEVARGRVVVIGGNLIGCETALDLAYRGHEVILLHEQRRLAEDANPINRSLLLDLLRNHGVKIHTGTRVVEVRDKTVVAVSRVADAAEFEAQVVVAAPRMAPRSAIVAELRGSADGRVLVVGSCRRAGALFEAVHEGFWAGATI